MHPTEATRALLEIAEPTALGDVLAHLRRAEEEDGDIYVDNGLLELLGDDAG
jgi:hypothetical protein